MARKRAKIELVVQADHVMREVYLPRIIRCLGELSTQQIWWRPNPASNSVGNLVLHLTGNVRQWITTGLGSAPDIRQRDREFSEQGPLPRRALASRLRKAVQEACGVLSHLSEQDLARRWTIQGFKVSGTEAIFHVAEHFSHHAGQIILVTKMLTGGDLKFTHLPGDQKRRKKALPAV